MYEEQRLKTVVGLIQSYRFQKPLNIFLRNYFRSNRKMGATDRRILSQCVYSFFRLGKSLAKQSINERIAAGLFLCTEKENDFYVWVVKNNSNLLTVFEEKIKTKLKEVEKAYPSYSVKDIFPFAEFASPKINTENFILSMLQQPKTWVRLRKQFRRETLIEFERKNILFHALDESDGAEIIGNVRLDELESFSKGYFEIQDLSSQKTADYFEPGPNSSWWDACAGSGGKSLLLSEHESSIKILATDMREKILFNLSERLRKAGVKNFKTRVLNLENNFLDSDEMFDGIIVDAPCTGSGTWARSPEWLSYFNSDLISEYARRQKKIVENALKNLKPGSLLIYITCSVFEKENQENVNYFIEKFNLVLERSEYFHGYNHGADTLFAARLIKE